MRLLQAARAADVHLITSSENDEDLQRARATGLLPPSVVIHLAPHSAPRRQRNRTLQQLVKQLHGEYHFDVVHHATPVSFRDPCPPLPSGLPIMWGPVRGTGTFPLRFLSLLPAEAILRQLAHTIINWCALWVSRRVHRAATSAATLLAANSSVRRSLRMAFGVEVGLLQDIGIDESCDLKRERFARPQGEPLRLLWAADLIPESGLILLLRAIASLPAATCVSLRVAGDGPALTRAIAQSHELAINVEFFGSLAPSVLQAELDNAHIFCSTSLIESGATEMIHALAAGVPVLCFDCQDGRDLIQPDCGVRIPVRTPRRAVEDWCLTLHALATDPELLLILSEQASARSCRYLWQRNGDRIRTLYAKLAQGPRTAIRTRPLV